MTGVPQIGPYQLGEPLGQGGMGTVYRARHVGLHTERALKLMHRIDPRALARFEREIQTLAQVQHPNVVSIHESGQFEGRPYFVMDLLAGEPLDHVLRRERLPWRAGLQLAIGIARGVGALHAAGIVHRDLKPQNVVLTDDRRPVVIDLGLAVAPDRDERLTKTGAFVGTLSYMAPEQFESHPATSRTDVYALGLLAFQLATWTPAVEDHTAPHQTVSAITAGHLPRPSQRDLDLPLALDAICAQATARSPEARYPDGNALADALETLLAAPGISARAKRRRTTIGILALALLVALGLTWAVLTQRPGPAPVIDSTTSTPTPQREHEDHPSPPPSPASPVSHTEGTQALRRIRRVAAAARIPQLRAWLARYPNHPRQPATAQALRELLQAAPQVRVVPGRVVARAVWLSPDRFMTASGRDLRVWNARTGAPLGQRRLDWRISTLAASPDGSRVAVGGAGGQLGWIKPRVALTFIVQRRVFRSAVRALCFDSLGRRLAATAGSGPVRLLPLPGLALEQGYRGHGSLVHALVFSSDDAYLFTSCGVSLTAALTSGAPSDSAIRRFSVESKLDATWRQPVTGNPNCLAFERGGRHLAAGLSTGHVLLYAPETGQPRRLTFSADPTAGAHHGSVRGVAFSANGQQLYSCATLERKDGGGIRTWDVATGALLETRGLGQAYVGLALSPISPPDGGRLLVWSREFVEVWALR